MRHFPTIRPAGRAESPVARRSSRALFLRVSWLYLMASFAAAAVTLMLVLVGGEFTIRQWLIWGPMIPIGLAIYTVADICFIYYQLRPISRKSMSKRSENAGFVKSCFSCWSWRRLDLCYGIEVR